MAEAHPHDPLIGQTFKDAYRVEKLIADGGMSLVYLAEQLSLHRYVVLKVLRPGFNDEDFIDLFLREARVYSQVNHPNVVNVIDFGRADNVVYMAMEYMDGGTLSDIVSHGGLSLANVLWVMEQVCAGVHAAHKLNIIHRDLKPSNIMVCKLSGDTTATKVLDFGISKPLSEGDLKHTRMGMVMGTPGFLSPEQISGIRDMDARVDVYSLGAILYYLITGQKPYDGASMEVVMHRQLSQPPAPLTTDNICDPKALLIQPVIFKAMSIEREHRHPDVISFWQDILNHANEHQTLPVNDEVANQPVATKYLFVFKGELLASANSQKTKASLQKLLKAKPEKIDKMFSQKRIIIRKNISLENAQRLAGLFHKAGAIGYIEEMENATRIIPKRSEGIPPSLPSANMVSPILAKDIPAVSHEPSSPPSSASSYTSAASSHFSHSQVASQISQTPVERKPNKKAFALFTLMSALIVVCGITWFIPSVRYKALDTWHYSILGNDMPRGISANEINIGMSAAFSGSAREIGQSMRNGINAAIKSANAEGGIHGRNLNLLSVDDGYEPEKAVENLAGFLQPDGVFAMLGNVGTPTAKAILPQALENKLVVFGTFSGASVLRQDPPDRYVFNYRASYSEETSTLIHYFVGIEKIDPKNIAVFYQNDSFGRDGLKGVEHALREYDVSKDEIIQASYQRNTNLVDDAIVRLRPHIENIEAIVLISTYAASASFTQVIREEGYTGKLANVSFVGARALVERLQEKGQDPEGIIISQVVPPYNSFSTGVLKYRNAMDTYFPGEQHNFISLEGYIAATLFIEALEKTGRYTTSEELVDTFEAMEGHDLGLGQVLSFSPSNHQASHRVWGSVVNAQGEFDHLELSEGEKLHGHD